MIKPMLIVLALITGAAYAGDSGWVTPGVNQNDVPDPTQPGTPVYPESSCIGAVVNGVCQGKIPDTDPKPKGCHGEMINGRCTGPMF